MLKKLKIILISLLFLLVMACSNEFARQEYNSNEKISLMNDHYAKEFSVFNSTNEEISLTISKFNGRETLWTKKLDKNRDIEINLSFRLSKGQAKIVHIDNDNNVTTIIECVPDTSTDGFVTKTISLKSGQNGLKIVGYDCENIDIKIEFSKL